MIYQEPDNWKDLQDKVGEILKQSNFKVEIEKKVQSIRSEIEIDVFATELIDGRPYKIICECKNWKSNIPQIYVHALRTVVNDIGANKAYIISTSNFQKGAIDSSEDTNIELVSWESFQGLFFKTWYINFFSKNLHQILKTDYNQTAIQFFDDFDIINKKDFRVLIDKYETLQIIASHFPPPIFKEFPNEFKEIENKLPLKTKLKLEEWEVDSLKIPNEILEVEFYSSFLNLISDYARTVYCELDKLNLDLTEDE